MAIYTKIASSEVGPALGKLLGKATGKFISTAKSTLTGLVMSKIQEVINNVLENNDLSVEDIEKIEQTLEELRSVLNNIQTQLSNIKTGINTLNSTAQSITAPLEALKAALMVIKQIPMPQMYLTVSITTVFSDTLETLAELIAQINETVSSLTAISKTLSNSIIFIEQYLTNALRILDLLKILLALLKAKKIASDKDLKDLQDMGCLDENNSVEPFVDTFKDLTIYSDLEDTAAAYNNGVDLLQTLQNSGLSDEVKEQLDLTLNNIPTVNTEELELDPKYYFTTKTGEILTLKVVIDPKSPKIAPQRYVQVENAGGSVVYTGTKSFANDPNVLIEETRVRLTQLFG